jgi:hypothetical protein
MFKKFRKIHPIKRVVFSLIIGFAVISFWRGLWGLWDVYVFPENYTLSLWISLVVGLIILILTHYATKELT